MSTTLRRSRQRRRPGDDPRCGGGHGVGLGSRRDAGGLRRVRGVGLRRADGVPRSARRTVQLRDVRRLRTPHPGTDARVRPGGHRSRTGRDRRGRGREGRRSPERHRVVRLPGAGGRCPSPREVRRLRARDAHRCAVGGRRRREVVQRGVVCGAGARPRTRAVARAVGRVPRRTAG